MSQLVTQQQQLKIVFKGTCACHRTTYTCTAIPTSTTKCHCTTCRKLSGAAYQAFLDLPSDSLMFTDTKSVPPGVNITLRTTSQTKDEGQDEGIRILKLSDVGDKTLLRRLSDSASYEIFRSRRRCACHFGKCRRRQYRGRSHEGSYETFGADLL